MKRSIAFLIALILLISLSACAAGNMPEGTPAAAATPVPSPSPTPVPEPVTPAGIPAYFAPGLQTVGAQPQGAYHIGVIAGLHWVGTAALSELQRISALYTDSFGVEVTQVLAGSEAEQLSAAQGMIGAGVDLLILSGEGDLGALGSLCDQNSVPYITMDCRAGTPGQGDYICSIERDDYLIGILTGFSIADTLTEKYGTAKGNIGEITGSVSEEQNILRSAGLRRALTAYPDIQVVCSITTTDDTAYHAAVNTMKAYGKGALDGIVVPDDAAAVDTLQAALNYSRDELTGLIWSAGGTKDGLTGVWRGQFAQTVEAAAQSGAMAFEYALQTLEGNGGDIPPVVCSMTRAFNAASQERLDAIAEIITQMDVSGIAYCMDTMGVYDIFSPDDRVMQIYPKHYYEYADIASYLAEFEPYTTEEAVYPAQ